MSDKFKELPSYEECPFTPENICLTIRIAKENEEEMVDMNTGEYLFVRRTPKSKQVLHDSAIYTKVFHNNIKLYDLSIPANNLFHYIVNSLTVMQTYICINEDDFLKEFNYKPGSRRLYYQAITELINRNIIKKKAKQSRCYWINMNILFNGDRTKLVTNTNN